ncbi:MAG: AurF N-oxygenase family protein [Micromonosporaceae bacterium]
MGVTAKARERTAQRLLASSARQSFDPLTEIDWDAQLAEDMFFMPQRRVSLYGTPLWDRMSRGQRIELSRHEAASVASVGIWFELILMQMLARYLYDRDPTSRHVQYGLTEIADECRHSVMFGRMIEKLNCPAYRVRRQTHHTARLMKALSTAPHSLAAILIAEEILDAMQREAMTDDSVQPLVRQVCRIHVIEEARHVRYAQEELARIWPRLSAARRAQVRLNVAWAAVLIGRELLQPQCYAAVGLPVREAYAAARANRQRHETLTWAATKVVSFFEELHLIDAVTRPMWRRAHLIA